MMNTAMGRDMAGHWRPPSSPGMDLPPPPPSARPLRPRTAKTTVTTMRTMMISTIGRVKDPAPWVCTLMFIAVSMILPRMNPSTMGGRGQPPCFMT